MRLTPIFLLMFSCVAYGQQVAFKKLPPCPKDYQSKFLACWGSGNFGTDGSRFGDYGGGSYFGEFKSGYFNGYGRFLWANGDEYKGEWINNDRHGRGVYKSRNGDFYLGEWSYDRYHGKGLLRSHDGKTFEGIWDKGTFIREEKLDLIGYDPSLISGTPPAWYAHPPVDKNYIFVGSSELAESPDRAMFLSQIFGKSQLRDFMKLRVQEISKILLSEIRESENESLINEVVNFPIEFQDFDSSVLREEWHFVKEKDEYRAFVLQKIPVEWIDGLLVEHISKNKNLEKIVLSSSLFFDLKTKFTKQSKHEKNQNTTVDTRRKIKLQVTTTQPETDGSFTINIQTNTDTASLRINGDEMGGRPDGRYTINRIARVGQDTRLDIFAKDVYGNSEAKTVTVSRAAVESKIAYTVLNPAKVKRQVERDAVAIIIGIANYKTLPKAEFANDDARAFYDYAIRALGVKPENIKLLVDADAEEVEIIKAFKTWLPSRVKSTTDVYVYYSGHGLPTQDGQGLYLLPPRADRDFISRTAIQFQEINADLQAAKPKSVTIFMDACYSGLARNGETLIANARPVALKAEKKLFPDNFTVITASQADQISSSSPDLKHGIFSYYLMKGMEGDADANKDGGITLGEMQAYLVENVGRQAGMMSRKQEPQLIGDVGKILVGR
jgi:hypothetical protein